MIELNRTTEIGKPNRLMVLVNNFGENQKWTKTHGRRVDIDSDRQVPRSPSRRRATRDAYII